jgi:hypothetical protein
MEYFLLHYLRRHNSIETFKSKFVLTDESLSQIFDRWRSLPKFDGDKVATNSNLIRHYIETLVPDKASGYAKTLGYSINKRN